MRMVCTLMRMPGQHHYSSKWPSVKIQCLACTSLNLLQEALVERVRRSIVAALYRWLLICAPLWLSNYRTITADRWGQQDVCTVNNTQHLWCIQSCYVLHGQLLTAVLVVHQCLQVQHLCDVPCHIITFTS
jgi:hypothetical protein